MKLDSKDKQILLALDMSARLPLTAIAKKVGLSKQVVKYRIERLERNEIIKGYHAVINHSKLNLKLYRIGIKLAGNKEERNAIIQYLKKQASWMVTSLGNWDLWLAVYVKDEMDFMDFWKLLKEKHGTKIASSTVSLMTQLWNYERSWIYPQKMNRELQLKVGSKPETSKLLPIDRMILEELTKHGRIQTTELALKLGKTERIIRYHLKKLEQKKVIVGYRPFCNIEELGMTYHKLFITLTKSSRKEINTIRAYLQNNPNVAYSTEALGGYDLEIEVQLENTKKLKEFMKELYETFPNNINDIEHLEYLDEKKMTYFPLTPQEGFI